MVVILSALQFVSNRTSDTKNQTTPERTEIHFLSDVFVAIASLDLFLFLKMQHGLTKQRTLAKNLVQWECFHTNLLQYKHFSSQRR